MVLAAAAGTSVVVPSISRAGVNVSIGISVGTPPPALPVYAQPPIPEPGYIWTPGYWAWGPAGYYWVPGVWVMPPGVGMLWTPGYWGWGGGAYRYHAGYWGPHIGFYGGVNYGFGYTGVGYEGGYWNHGAFAYNRSVNNINNVHVTNVYNRTVVVNNVNRVSYNGGRGGLNMQPNASERAALNERHAQPTQNQMQHEQTMRNDRGQLAAVNHGNPQTMAMSRVGERSANPQQRTASNAPSGQPSSRETQHAERSAPQAGQQVHATQQAQANQQSHASRQNNPTPKPQQQERSEGNHQQPHAKHGSPEGHEDSHREAHSPR